MATANAPKPAPQQPAQGTRSPVKTATPPAKPAPVITDYASL